ncbi:hypothetical protein B4O97_00360 [Marispirochaeta aestuarii]|uniref:TonB-dependent receptor-like beta-barrel domain-containing protein n=1 Tax=Marispirochaeta aestuarii TaxID=1963862 RepID=A0A1Y1S3Y1_9SPIO|nr:TonB-dependent receptor [Marispirochaeta aestuarii]ORC38244.1 hypothetical protein B4O97_00360 [Marispirochaeta aestuarii]
MMHTRNLFLLLILPLLSFSLFTQETPQDSEPDVELPELSLSFEDVFGEDLPLVELQLEEALAPGLPELSEPEGVLQVRPHSIDLPSPVFDALPYGSDSAPLYGRGYIGLGSSNSLMGEIEIATLGADPGFGLSYSHSSLDGFGGNSPGEGYTFRREEARVKVDYSGTGADAFFSGSFIEEERGLQGESPFSSTLYRTMGAEGGYELPPDRGWYGGPGFDVSGAYQNLSGTSPEDTSHFTLSPVMRGGYAWSSFMLGAEGRYSFRSGSEGDYIQYLRLDLNAEGDLSPRVGFIAEAGVAYIVDGDVRFPFSLLLSAGLSENVSMEASGGYYHSLGDYAALLSMYPFLRIPEEPLAAEEGWEGDLSLRLRLGHDLYLRLGSSLTAGTRYRAGDAPEPASSLLPVAEKDVRELGPRGNLEFPLGKTFFGSFSAGLRYDYEESSMEAFDVGLGVESEGLTSRLGLRLQGDWDLSDNDQTPVLGSEVWYEPLESIRFILGIDDALGLLDTGGRKDDSGLEVPGFVIRFATEISL